MSADTGTAPALGEPLAVDVSFALCGATVPLAYRRPLAAALTAHLPWLATLPQAAVHRLKLAGTSEGRGLLSRRTRLVLRLPLSHATAAQALQGQTLDVAGTPLAVGEARISALKPWGTLYAHLVVAAGAGAAEDEAAFLKTVQAQLDAQGLRARAICGRLQVPEGEALQGHGLMLDGLSAADAGQVLATGLGPHRLLGCGVFVPHKSSAAVGAPD
jgi:CRISPR-associated protein Cas6